MSAPILHPGDLIHLAMPMHPSGQPNQGIADATVAAYKRLGVQVFMIDHMEGLDVPQIVAVVRLDPRVIPTHPSNYDRR